MKKEYDIRVELVRMEGDLAPFVQVGYMDRDAQEHTGLLLLDSGSSVNILAPEMADVVGVMDKLKGDGENIIFISHEQMNADNVRFSFALGGRQFHEIFCLSSRPFPVEVKEMTVVGLVGTKFLQQHRLVIDFSDYTLHTSTIHHGNFSSIDCDFFFPMEIGLRYWDIPVLAVKQNDKEIVALVDTGATDNLMAKQTLKENEFECKFQDGKDCVRGISGEVSVDEAQIKFNFLSLQGEDVCEISRRWRFKILPDYVYPSLEGYCDENGDRLPPIEMLFGAPYLANERYTLDFGAKLIYKNKNLGNKNRVFLVQ